MADKQAQVDAIKKKHQFKKYTYRGVELDNLVDLPENEFVAMLTSRHRRKYARGIKRKVRTLIQKCVNAKKGLGLGEKPEPVKTHLRDVTIVPQMSGSIIGVYNGKGFVSVEVKPDMIGHYLGEFSLTYKPVGHGRPGFSAANAAKFIPMK